MQWKSFKVNKIAMAVWLTSAASAQAELVQGVDYIEVAAEEGNGHAEFIENVKNNLRYKNPEPKDISDLVWAKTEQLIGFYRVQVGSAYEWVSYEEATAYRCQALIEHARITGNQIFSCSAADPRLNEGFNEWIGVVNYRARYMVGVTPSPYDRPGNFRSYIASAPKEFEDCSNPEFPVGPRKISETTAICLAKKYEDLLEQGESECMAGNPVNVATGNKHQSEIDATLRDFSITRDYNSTAAKSGTESHFGIGWNSGFNRKLDVQGDNLVFVHRSSGKLNIFEKNEAGKFVHNDNPNISLKKISNKYHYKDAEWEEIYNESGKLISFSRRGQPTVWTLSYENNQSLLPKKITSNFGDKVKIEKNSSGLVHSVKLNDSFVVEYDYDRQKRLVQVKRPEQLIEYHYEDGSNDNLLTGISVAGSRFSTWTYDDQGRVVKSEHANDTEISEFKYSDKKTTVTNAYGKETVYTFKHFNGIKKPVKVAGKATDTCIAANKAYTYDKEGKVKTQTDWNGNKVKFTYHDSGLAKTVMAALGTPKEQVTRFAYDDETKLPTRIETPTLKSEFTYNHKDQLVSKTITDKLGKSPAQTWSYEYNPKGLLIAEDGPRTDVSDITRYTYTSNGYIKTITNAAGHVSEYLEYNDQGLATEIQGPNGLITKIDYTDSGRVSSTTMSADGKDLTTSFTYTPFGKLATIEQPTGLTLTYSYNAAQYLTSVCNQNNECTRYTRDATGKTTQKTVIGSGGDTVYSIQAEYDSLGRILNSLGSSSQKTTFERDANGNIVKTSVQGGDRSIITSSTFDALNQLKAEVSPDGGNTAYEYTDNGALSSVNDPEGLSTRYTRDGFGNTVERESPNTGKTSYSYDSAGNLISKTNNLGQATTYEYDVLNRLTKEITPEGETTYHYDNGANAKGRLTKAENANSSSEYQYNGFGLVTEHKQVINGDALVIRKKYNNRLQLEELTYPSGKTVKYHYDELNRVTEISLGSSSIISNIQYLPFGPVSGFTYGNELVLSKEFDQDYRLTKLQIGNLVNKTFGWNPLNQITSITGTQSEAYTYDVMGRLTGDNGSSYSYDKTGNREKVESKADSSNRSTYNYQSNTQQLLSISKALASGTENTAITYDQLGNISAFGETLTLEHNSQNQLVKSTSEEVEKEYFYSPNGYRNRVKTGDAGVNYFYDNNANLLVKGNRELVYFGSTPVAAIEGENLYYIHTGHLGEPLAATNSEKAKVWEASYSAFGEVTTTTIEDGISLDLRFPGQVDDYNGLYYNIHRYYSPSVGRYIESDPIGLDGGVNTYLYSGGNPVTFVDPTGEAFWFVIPMAVRAAHMAMSVYDAYNAASTMADPCVSGADKLGIAGQLALDILLPGGSKVFGLTSKLASKGSNGAIKSIKISKNKYPETAQHIQDAQAAGHPKVLTIDRAGTKQNRKESLKGIPTQPNKDRDEYPPAMFKEGGEGASVRHINPSDNRGAGKTMGLQCKGLACGTKVQIDVVD